MKTKQFLHFRPKWHVPELELLLPSFLDAKLPIIQEIRERCRPLIYKRYIVACGTDAVEVTIEISMWYNAVVRVISARHFPRWKRLRVNLVLNIIPLRTACDSEYMLLLLSAFSWLHGCSAVLTCDLWLVKVKVTEGVSIDPLPGAMSYRAYLVYAYTSSTSYSRVTCSVAAAGSILRPPTEARTNSIFVGIHTSSWTDYMYDILRSHSHSVCFNV